MPTVRFLQDFQGVETNGVFYQRDQVAPVPDGVASRCVADGRAELVKVVEVEVVEVADEPNAGAGEGVAISGFEESTPADTLLDEQAPVITTTNHQARHRRGR